MPALAASPGLLDKTVTLTWNTSGTAKRADGSPPFSFSNHSSRVIYISSAGRTFTKVQLRGERGAMRESSRGPDDGGSKGSVSVQGNTLVGVDTFMSGARQYRVSFDPSFSSCTVEVIYARSGGADIKRKGPDGAMYEVSNVSTGSPGCSIQSGNAFAH
jgi:hypothetical protein